MSKKYRYPLVEVLWDDAEGDPGWQDPPDELHPKHVRQVGFLIKETKKHILLAAAYIENKDDKQISSTDKIPKGMISEFKYLNGKPKGKRK